MCQYEKHKYFIMNHHNYCTANKVCVMLCMWTFIMMTFFYIYICHDPLYNTHSFFLIYVLLYVCTITCIGVRICRRINVTEKLDHIHLHIYIKEYDVFGRISVNFI